MATFPLTQLLATLGTLDGISDGQRQALIELYGRRVGYYEVSIKLAEIQIQSLRDPGNEALRAQIDTYTTTIVYPARMRLAEQMNVIFNMAVDIDSMRQMLPMFGTTLLQCIDIVGLLDALGVSKPIGQKVADAVTRFIDSDELDDEDIAEDDSDDTEENEETGRFTALIDEIVDLLADTNLSKLSTTVDHKAIVNFLPAMAIGMLQHVNLGLIMTLLGIDPDNVERIISDVKGYLGKEVDSAE